MEFNIRAKYTELIGMREELARLEKQLLSTEQAADPKGYEELQSRVIKLRTDAQNLSGELAITSDMLRSKLGEALRSAEGDLAKASQGFRSSADEAIRLGEAMRQAQEALSRATAAGSSSDELDRLAAAAKEAERAFWAQTDVQEEFRKKMLDADVEAKKFAASIKDIDDALNPVEENAQSAGEAIAKMTAVIAGGYSIKEFIGNIVSARMEMQNMQTSLETMVGKDTASALFDQLFTLAKKSPLEMTDMVGAEQMMISFGIDAQKSVEYLTALSDISMGNAAKFNSLTLAFSQMSATGKLMGQDLNQMINQGFNPLEAISQKTGKSIAALKDEMSKGKITAEMVQQAFIDVTKEGGRFYNMSEAASKTIQGQISMFEDALSTMYNTMGVALEGVVMDTIKAATTLVENWQKIVPVLISVAGAIGIAKAALVLHVTWQKAANLQQTINLALQAKGQAANASMAKAIWQVVRANISGTAAQMGLNAAMAACPYVLIGAAIAGLCYGIYRYATSMTEAEQSHENLNKAMAEADKEADKEKRAILDLVSTMTSLEETSAQYASTKSRLVEEARKYNAEVADEIEKGGLTEDMYARLSASVENYYRVKAYLRWQDSEEQRRQEVVMEQMSEIRSSGQEWVEEAKTDKERLERTQKLAAALREIKKLEAEGKTAEHNSRDDIHKITNLSDEANDTLSSIVRSAGLFDSRSSIKKQITALLKDSSEMRAEIRSETNKALFGLSDDDLDAEKKRQQDEAAKKAEDERKKKEKQDAEKEKQNAESKKKEMEKQAAERKKIAEALAKEIAKVESDMDADAFKRREASLTKERDAIVRDYDTRIKAIEEKEKEVAEAKKKGAIDDKTAGKYSDTLQAAKGRLTTEMGEDISKLYADEIRKNSDSLTRKHEEFERKRLEISKKYAEQRARLEEIVNAGDSTEAQKTGAGEAIKMTGAAERADLAKVDLDEFKSSEQYTRIFQDLSKFGMTTISTLKAQMEQFGGAIRQSLNPADAKAFEEAIGKLNDRLVELDPFAAWKEGNDELAAAMTAKETATRRVTEAMREYESVTKQIEKAEKDGDETKVASLRERQAKAVKAAAEANTELAKAEDDEATASTKMEKGKVKVSDAFKELESNAQAVTDVLGVQAGNVFSFIDSTVTLVNTSIDGMKAASTAASAALQAVETASVILAIIGAALKVVQALSKFFGKNKGEESYQNAVKKQQEINKLRQAVEEYTTAVLDAQHAEETWFSTSGGQTLKQNWESAADALAKYNSTLHEEQTMYQDRLAGSTLFGGGSGRNTVSAYYEAKRMGYDPTWNVTGLDPSALNAMDFKVQAKDNLRFETQARKHGTWFRKGKAQKTVDLRTWTKENLGVDLFDADDNLNVEAAETLINDYGDKLVGETKATLEKLVEQQKAYNEAMDAIKQQVSDWYAPLVDDMTDAILNWLDTGEDALSSFKKSAGDTFRSIASDMIKTMTQTLIFKNFDSQIEELAVKYAKGEMSMDEMMQQSVDLVDSTMHTAETAIPVIEEATRKVNERLKESGIDITSTDSDVEASGGGFQTMSEDTATELSGRFTALYESGLRQEASLTAIASGIGSNGFISSLQVSLCNITAGGFSDMLTQAAVSNSQIEGVSQCLAESLLVLRDIHDTNTRQEKHLAAIKKEVVEIRKTTDTL